MAEIEVSEEGAQPRRVRLAPGRSTVGRAAGNQIRIASDRVSSQHLELWCSEPGVVRVRDLGSKNGTTLDGRPLLGEHRLREHEELVLGSTVRVRLVDAAAGFERSRITPGPSAELWAIERARHLVHAPSRLARFQYLVTEVERLLSGQPSVWVLAWEGDPDAGTPSFSALVHGTDPQDVPSPGGFSTSIAWQAARRGEPIWLEDARSHEAFRSAESVHGLRLRSVGCVPIGRRAVLYLADATARGRFDERVKGRLEALCALAGQLEEPPVADDTVVIDPELLPGLVGRSQAMVDVARQARAFARFSWNVLLLGEPGTGKSALARAIHELSGRAGPFVHVNCATLTDSLASSELFGSVRGAYSEARDRPGYVGAAAGGTLFLDEVGDLSSELQAKLLQVLRERTYTRVGEEERPRTFTGRVVAATNRPLEVLRDDLLTRLREATLELPPLRGRPEDVPLLAQVFLERLRATEDVPDLAFSPQALDLLASGDLRGNVAGLESAVKRGFMWAVQAGSVRILVEHLEPPGPGPNAEEGEQSYLEAVHAFERRLLLEALERHGGNKTRTAEALGMTNRQQLLRHLERLGLL